MDEKREQLQWLLDNIDNFEIVGIYPNGENGEPTLLITFDYWKTAESSPFEINDCSSIVFE